MVQNITLCADELLLSKAMKKAEAEHSTLNAKFLQWIEAYIGITSKENEYKALMEQLSHVQPGGKYSRDEMNER